MYRHFLLYSVKNKNKFIKSTLNKFSFSHFVYLIPAHAFFSNNQQWLEKHLADYPQPSMEEISSEQV